MLFPREADCLIPASKHEQPLQVLCMTLLDGQNGLLSVGRKAAGSLKIVHEKYGEKMKNNVPETEAYYREFNAAKAINEAMEAHISKVRAAESICGAVG